MKARAELIANSIQSKNRNEKFYSKADHKNRLRPQANAPKAPMIVKNLSSILNLA